jgi:Phage phiEco32-like COOH.NH2 ligase-type 2
MDIYEENIQDAFYTGRTDVLRPIAERNLANLQRLASYERYKEYIDPCIDMIHDGQTWDEQTDVKRAWGITQAQRIRQVKTKRTSRRFNVRA